MAVEQRSRAKRDHVAAALQWMKRQRVLALLIVTGIAVIGLASVTDALFRIADGARRMASRAERPSETVEFFVPSDETLALSSLDLERVLRWERGNLERCLRPVTARLIRLVFEIEPGGKLSNIYVYGVKENPSAPRGLPAPQTYLCKSPDEIAEAELHRGRYEARLIGGEVSECVVNTLLKYRYKAEVFEGKRYFNKYFSRERQ